MFAAKEDVDEDILAYVISCLEDETFEFGSEGDEIFDAVGMMLVRSLSATASNLKVRGGSSAHNGPP